MKSSGKQSVFIPPAILAVTGLLCLLLSSVIPEKGILVGGLKLRFITMEALLGNGPKPELIDVQAYLARLDSLQAEQERENRQNLEKAVRTTRKEGLTSIQFRDLDSSPFFPFFEALESAKASGRRLHVLHYGDSQIEMDRMSGYLRQEWQKRFGGNGPGLLPPVPLAPPSNVAISGSSNWSRHAAYGYDNGKLGHNRFGILASLGRFASEYDPSKNPPKDSLEGWIEITASKLAKSEARVYTGGAVYFGYHNAPVSVSVFADDSLVGRRTYAPQQSLLRHSFQLNRTPERLRLVFRGKDSPDVQAILLDHGSGVYVDNIAMRGSGGTVFTHMAPQDMRKVLDDLDVGLIILQFGGNAVPYVTTEKQATDYAASFRSQIRLLKKLVPQTAFLVIGPSDMSTWSDGDYISWPGVELVRDAMKTMSLNEGCGFWDMYEVMGGHNSMISWVEGEPAFAGPDYTHFTPLGARRMAELLHKSIMKEFDAWKTGRQMVKDESMAN